MVQLIWTPEPKADDSNGPSAASKTQPPPTANNLEIKGLQISQVHDVRGRALDAAD
ncbi:hypothetical protein GCM10007858_21860 [Bradyrhizobium liaoningense]|nr:hypothetical protein GCM10007858_21860 [Bradyrhizobium liaoningense]